MRIFYNNDVFFEELCNKINNKIPFAFSRWGDGEWLTVAKSNPTDANCDGNYFYTELGDKLISIVREKQDYYMGHQNVVGAHSLKDKYPQEWVNSDLFHEISEERGLDDVFNLFHNVHIVYIGNKSLSKLSFIDEFIEIPYNNVWLKYDEVLSEIKSKIIDDECKVFLFSAGMASNAFIHDLWNYNNKNVYMDASSAFDPYVGRKTRSYHHRLNLDN